MGLGAGVNTTKGEGSTHLEYTCFHVCSLQRIKRKLVGQEVKGVGVMKDEEVMLEEIETSHSLGGYRRCRCYSTVRYTIVNRFQRICCQ